MTKKTEKAKRAMNDSSMEWAPTGAPTIDMRSTVTHGNDSKIFVPGSDRAMLTFISRMIDRADSMVLLSSFLLQGSPVTEAIDAAVRRGVDVFILTGNEDKLKREGDEYDAREDENARILEHKKLLAGLAGKALVRTSPDFHAKYVLIDPNSRSQQGLFMTCNITVGALSGNNIELCVKLEGDEVQSYFNHFVHGFWLVANHELLTKNIQPVPTIDENKLNRILPGNIGVPCTSKGINDLEERIRKIINDARKSVTICAWSFDEGMEWQDDVMAALKNGREVKVLCRCDDRNLKALAALARAGAKVMGFGDPPIHAKVVMNESAGIIMSSNLTRLGLETGFEASYVLSASDLNAMEGVIKGWVAHCPMGLVLKGEKDANDSSPPSGKDNGINSGGSASTPPKGDTSTSLSSSPTQKGDSSGLSKNKRSSDGNDCGTVVMMLPRGCRPSGMEGGYDLFSSEDGRQTYLVVDSHDEVSEVRALAMKKGYVLALRRNDEG